MSCWNQTLESFIDKSSLTGFGSFKITFTSGSDWIISCNFLRKCVNFNKVIFNHPMNVSDISRLQIYRGNAFERSFSAKSYVRNCIWYILSAPTGVLNRNPNVLFNIIQRNTKQKQANDFWWENVAIFCCIPLISGD